MSMPAPSFSNTMDFTSVSWREATWLCPCPASCAGGPPPWPPPCPSWASPWASSEAQSPWPPSWLPSWPPPWPSPWFSPSPWPSPCPVPWPSSGALTKFTSSWPPCCMSSFAASKASMARSSPRGTSFGFFDKQHSRIGTKELMPRMTALVSSIFARSHTSILFNSSLSAKPTCCAFSLTEPSVRSRFSWVRKCLQSTTVTMPSILQYFLTSSSIPKVFTIGPGSAMPVVSISMPSSIASVMPLAYLSSTVLIMSLIAAIKSSRTVQQRHPLSRTVIDSTVSSFPTAWSSS
mmetsp:Transcript_26856/g.43091  ORF Transcript_26856/g.43091 Transcript_26856/m.43091 type:complete len:291 (-) Transcript_26856:318-1190(-)